MPYILHIPGARPKSYRWVVDHPASSYGSGVLIERNGSGILDGAAFRRLRDKCGAWIETDWPDRARSALRLMHTESLGEP